MKFVNAFPYILIGASCYFVNGSTEGIGAHHRRSEEMLEVLDNTPLQTFYIPFPESSMFTDFFFPIRSDRSVGPVVSLISMSISTDNTIIWYDHWEDGFDVDAANATTRSALTEVWGDGNATNGCRPFVASCTDATDKLMAGTSFVIQNNVVVPRDASVLRWDGGDKVQANFPIAITRGGYPTKPGSLLAGAVEVLDTSLWGTNFVAPVGTNTVKASFEFSAFLFMAKEANTTVKLPDNTTVVLNEGESRLVKMRINSNLTSDKPIQVDLITGDIGSEYESRWFSLLDTAQWSNEYVSPTGESFAKTKLVLYNPHTLRINITMDTLVNGTKSTANLTVAGRGFLLSPVIPDGSGARVKGTNTFLPLSITDSEIKTADNFTTGGQWYDWGFPLQPLADLTPQVLIAWGYGCTNNNCSTYEPRNVVWITPIADADIYVDFKNQGSNLTVYPRKALSSTKITDPYDKDMSGAIIFATEPNSTASGRSVPIAASWGQDPIVSKPMQQISLDLGTTVLPFANLRVTKVVDKEYVSPGESLIYTIRIYNLGQSTVRTMTIRLFDTLDPWVEYVPGTTTAAVVSDPVVTVRKINDNSIGTKFPLDESGFLVPLALPRRGGMIDVSFEVKLKSGTDIAMKAENIINTGTMREPSGTTHPFDAISKVVYSPNITLSNTVYVGSDADGTGCPSAVEHVAGASGTNTVYCFNITNTGSTFLTNVTLNDQILAFTRAGIKTLAPGESVIVAFPSSILGDLANNATVVGNPAFANETEIPDMSDVNATDPSSVGLYVANITLTNTVYLGNDAGGSGCGSALEYVEGLKNTEVVYCFNITNNGSTHLGNITLTDGSLVFNTSDIKMLAPGESVLVPFKSSILANLTNMAIVSGNPVDANGTALPNMSNVNASDPSAVGKMRETPREPPYSPPGNETKCLQDSWNETYSTGGDLLCTTKEVYLESLKSQPITCVLGEMVNVSVTAAINIESTRSDLGWYVAADGGDALEGKCIVNGLQEMFDYTITNTTTGGEVTFDDDACGDVTISGQGKGVLEIPVVVNSAVLCADENEDGLLDMAVCFTWNTKATDSICTLSSSDPATKGVLPDLYPGAASMCYCESYNIPNTTVVKPNDDPVPCK